MPITINTATDGPLKRELIEPAFSRLSMAGYEFGRTPEEIADALGCLNVMMNEWPWSGLGYNSPPYGLGSADDYSGVRQDAVGGVIAELSLRLAPIMGATLSPDATKILSVASFKTHSLAATIPTMPREKNTIVGMGTWFGDVYPFATNCDEDDTVDDCDD